MLEAVEVDRIGDGARSFRDRHKGNPLCLHVRWKAGKSCRCDIDRGDFFRRLDFNGRHMDVQFCAGVLEPRGDCSNVPGIACLERHFSAADRARGQHGSCFDSIGNRLHIGRVQRIAPLDLERAGSDAFDFRPHGDEEFNEVYDLRFHCRIFYSADSFGKHGGHQDVPRRAHAGYLERYPRTFQSPGLRDDIAPFQVNCGSQLL